MHCCRGFLVNTIHIHVGLRVGIVATEYAAHTYSYSSHQVMF